MPGDLQSAIWDGPFDAELPDSSVVRRGEEYLVTSEDAKSAWWLTGETPSEPEPEPEPTPEPTPEAEPAPEAEPTPEPEPEPTSEESGF